MKKKMTKRQVKAWRKRRQHVNARRKMANRVHNYNRDHMTTDVNPAWHVSQNQADNPSLMMSVVSAVNNMINMWRRSGQR